MQRRLRLYSELACGLNRPRQVRDRGTRRIAALGLLSGLPRILQRLRPHPGFEKMVGQVARPDIARLTCILLGDCLQRLGDLAMQRPALAGQQVGI
jgi:hypothetical protein